MATIGASASNTGDKLNTQVVPPAWPQSNPVLGVQGGTDPLTGLGDGDLLIRLGFQVAGQSASEADSQAIGQGAGQAEPPVTGQSASASV